MCPLYTHVTPIGPCNLFESTWSMFLYNIYNYITKTNKEVNVHIKKNKIPKLTGNHAITVARYSLVPLFTLYLLVFLETTSSTCV